MPSITISIPDIITVAELVNETALYHGYKEQITNPLFNTDASAPPTIANPESKAQFARRMLREDIKGILLRNRKYANQQGLLAQRQIEDMQQEALRQTEFANVTMTVT